MYNDFGGQRYLMEHGSVIMRYIKECGTFMKEQAYLMLPQKHYSTVDKVLRGLKAERCIFEKEKGYYVANPRGKINYKMLNCLWVLLDMKGDAILKEGSIDAPFWLKPATQPALLSYVKNTILYDIVPVNRGEEIILKVLEDNYKQEQEKYPESKHKYIIVVPNESVLETMPELEIPHLFAIVKELSSSQMDYESKNLVDIDYYEG